MRSGSALSFSNTFMAASAASASPSASSSAAANGAQGDLDLDGEPRECPLCMEELDLSDLNFKPCPCGYQICRFCWHHIKQNLNGCCPACRKVYDDDSVEFTPLKAEDLKKLQNAKKQRDREKKDQEINSRKHLANVRVKQKTQVHIQGMTARLASEENIPLLKSHEWFGQHGKILKLFLAKRTNMPESMQATIDTKNQPVNVYINYASTREAAACITAVDGTTTPDGHHRLRAGWGTTKYCPSFLRNQRCHTDNCMMAHEPGEEVDPVGGAPGPITREEMSTLKHAMKEQESREAQQRYGPNASRVAPGLPATASWAKMPMSASHQQQQQQQQQHHNTSNSNSNNSPPLSSNSPLPNVAGPSSRSHFPPPPSSSISAAKTAPGSKSHPLPARPTTDRQNSQTSPVKPGTIRRPSASTEEPARPSSIVTSIAPAGKPSPAPTPGSEAAPSPAASAPPGAPPGLPPPPGLHNNTPSSSSSQTPTPSSSSWAPVPSTSSAGAAGADEADLVRPFATKSGDFTFNFNPEISKQPKDKQSQPFELDLAPTGSGALSDGLFSAADLLLSPPPDAYALDDPEVLSNNLFDPFADTTPVKEDPELRPKSSRFDFAKRSRGLFGSTESLQGLATAAAVTPPTAALDAPPGIGARGFPNGLLGPERTASPSSLFAPSPSATPAGPSAATMLPPAHGPPPGLRRQSSSVQNRDPWGSSAPAGSSDALSSRGTSRAPSVDMSSPIPPGFGGMAPGAAVAKSSLPSFSHSSMALASAALPALSSAATHPLPPPSAGLQPQSQQQQQQQQSSLPPGFAHLARQPLPSALAAASNYPLPPPSSASGRATGPPPGLSPQLQRTNSASPSNGHSKDSSELFSHLMSLANNTSLRSPSESPAGFQDPAILNMSSAQHYPATYQQYGNGGAYGQYYAAQQQQQQQRSQPLGYNPGLPPGMIRR